MPILRDRAPLRLQSIFFIIIYKLLLKDIFIRLLNLKDIIVVTTHYIIHCNA